MPRLANIDGAALAHLVDKQHGVLTRAQARACGVTGSMLQHRLHESRVWQVLLPGVYLTFPRGMATPAQREMAALLYAGPASMITGPAALFSHGVRVPYTEVVDVLVPVTTQRANRGFVRLHRTERMPAQSYARGEVRYAPVARAIADAARLIPEIGEVRAVVADAVQRGRCPLGLLAEEVRGGPRQGSAFLRRAIAEVTVGVRSAAEADLRDLIARAGLPMPMFNPRLFIGGEFIAQPDCWWPDAGVAAEVDSREWHLSPRDWERTLARHASMSAHGITVLHFTPRQIKANEAVVAANLRSALEIGRDRPPLPVKAVPPG